MMDKKLLCRRWKGYTLHAAEPFSLEVKSVNASDGYAGSFCFCVLFTFTGTFSKGFVIDADLRFKMFGVIGSAFLDYSVFNLRTKSIFLDPLLKLTFGVMMRYVFSQPSP